MINLSLIRIENHSPTSSSESGFIF